MAEAKTKITDASVEKFLNSITDETKRKDCQVLAKLMQEITGEPPKMWGTSIVGFGTYHYKYDSGHEGDSGVVSFSPRKQNITLYLMGLYIRGGVEAQNPLLKNLGKHKTGKGCLYINKLADVDMKVLKEIIIQSNNSMKEYMKMKGWK